MGELDELGGSGFLGGVTYTDELSIPCVPLRAVRFPASSAGRLRGQVEQFNVCLSEHAAQPEALKLPCRPSPWHPAKDAVKTSDKSNLGIPMPIDSHKDSKGPKQCTASEIGWLNA